MWPLFCPFSDKQRIFRYQRHISDEILFSNPFAQCGPARRDFCPIGPDFLQNKKHTPHKNVAHIPFDNLLSLF